MTPLVEFMPLVLPWAPSCSTPMAEQAVMAAAIEFAARTCVVQRVGSADTEVGQTEYAMTVPPGVDLNLVHAVFHGDRRLEPLPREMVDSGEAVGRYGGNGGGGVVAQGSPVAWFVRRLEDPVVSVFPAPARAEAGALTVVASFTPCRAATCVPRILFDDYAEDVAAGALDRLLRMPAQPFTNPAFAPGFAARFQAAMSEASALARGSRVTRGSWVRPRRFAV